MGTRYYALVFDCGHGGLEELGEANQHVFRDYLCPLPTDITHPYNAPRLYIGDDSHWEAYLRSCHEVLRLRACNTVFRAMYYRVWRGIRRVRGERDAVVNLLHMDILDIYGLVPLLAALPHHRHP